jgi:DNA polymerase-3 subunit delta'
MDILTGAALPWLAGAREQLLRAERTQRLPHSLLLLAAPGLGAEALARWAAALALCEAAPDSAAAAAVAVAPAVRPCGSCASCLLLKADSHPDLHLVRPEQDKRQISVDQVRALIEALTFKSYRGGFKVGVVESAESLNANGANAFLKTLEEPTQNTMLILIATPAHRLPATIASRCVRLVLRAPEAAVAAGWLEAQAGPAADGWGAALALAGGAPLFALELQGQDMAGLEADMRETLKQLRAGSADVTLIAERWARSDPALRLTWLENWITRRVCASLGAPAQPETAEPVRLPAALLKPKIRALFDLLDAAREFRRFASTGMNQQLALEALLLRGRAVLSR